MASGPVCRTCMVDGVELFGIFEDTGLELALPEKLNDYLRISIDVSDEYASMCGKCISTLNEFHDMFSLAQEVQSQLKSGHVQLKKEEPVELMEGEAYVEIQDGEFIDDVQEDMDEDHYPQQEEVIIEETVDEEEQPMTAFENAPQVTYQTLDDMAEMGEDEIATDEEEDYVQEGEEEEEDVKQNHHRMSSFTRGPKPRQIRESCTAEQREKENELIRQTVALICTDCNFSAPLLEELLAHQREIHKKQGVFVCCDKEFTKRVKLLEHVKLHNDPKAFSCETCGKHFTSKYTLATHMGTHLPEEMCQFTCDVCGKKYPSQARLNLHLKIHSNEEHVCHICNKKYALKGTLVAHIKSVHERADDAFICDICAKPFKTKEAFLTHQMNHMENPPPRISCPLCPKKLKHRESLNQHLLRHKRANDQHFCDICNKEFNCIKRLRAHKKFVHTTEKFQCEHCEKSFKRPIYLKEHMAQHTGEALYSCAFCPRTFNSNANKYSHQKAQHPVEWENARRKKLEE